ncbi:riboflavin synthase [Gordonia polyisoprenivorans]|uniref:riboflavin synthase n=1 Tax=Gordonia polyisoprenivorans TaxID=84595 RepID=UPI001AD60855|nr:riboflavin synthase [Gordonia polyisoprenivorans]QTI67047.1 riboflavin synthase [Gordonia polyisoprenivorans]
MFTGIVEELGTIVGRDDLADAARLTIRGPRVTSDAGFGDSIAVNGVCLTVVEFDDQQFTVDVMAETLRRSSLDRLGPGSSVNLERAMRADGRFGGHIVQGHVDGTGTVVAITPSQNWTVVRIGVDPRLSRYLVEKGSITVDGVSLTVSAIGAGSEASGPGDIGAGSEASGPGDIGAGSDGDWFEISLIPTTLQETNLGSASVGAVVNLEIDVLAKYVERLQATRAETTRTPKTSGATSGTAEVK